MSRHIFSLTLRVDNPSALQRAAFMHYVADNNHAESAYADAATLFGTSEIPNIDACLVQLLDPGSLIGCSIDDSCSNPRR